MRFIGFVTTLVLLTAVGFYLAHVAQAVSNGASLSSETLKQSALAAAGTVVALLLKLAA